MKVYLDDLREAPHGWHRTKTVADTIAFLKTGEVTHLSLDHDLAEEHYLGTPSKEPTGYDVLLWLERQVIHGYLNYLPDMIIIHSMNAPARSKMEHAVKWIYKFAAMEKV